MPSGSRYEIEALDGGTRLIMSTWVSVPPGMPVDVTATQAAMQAFADRYVARVKTLLESPPLGGLLPDASRH